MLSDDDPPPNTMKRLPLTPIPVDGPFPTDDDVKSTSSMSYVPVSRSHSDDELRPSLYQRRKSSVPALTLGKAPYNRRRSHNRRPSPPRNSPGIPASLTPIHANFNSERRTSLPALHFHETVQTVMPLHIETRSSSRRGSISEDIYGGLQSFTFGAPPTQVHHDSDDSDEDERLRRDRAKMRAIDDGTRRPSLPTNECTPAGPRSRQSFSSITSSVAPSMASSAHIVVGERQFDEHGEPDWDIVMGDITPTKTSPPPATPTSGHTTSSAGTTNELRRPSVPIPVPGLRRRSHSTDELASDLDRIRGTTPTQLSTSTPSFSWTEGHLPVDARGRSSSPEENALDGFDLEFILSQPAAAAEAERLQRQTSSGRLRSKFRSKAAHANTMPPRVEDTFTGHLGQYDPVYERRKREWSFRREVRTSQKVKDKDRAIRLSKEQEKWRCEWIGRFVVIKSVSVQHPVADAPKLGYNRLQIVHTADPSNKGNRNGGPRVLVHRHSRARAFSIFRAYMLPKKVMVPTESVLMAVKSVLKEYTRTESTRALKTHGLIDDEDSRPSHRHRQHRELRSSTGSHGGSPRQSQLERSRSNSSGRPGANIATEAVATTSEASKPYAPGPSQYSQPSTSHSQSQSSEMRSRKDSTCTLASSSRSTSRSGSTSRPSSLGISRVRATVEPSTPVPHWDMSTGTSPRTSTSHAKAFAMRDLDTCDLDAHHHHRDGAVSSVQVPPQHAAPLPLPTTPSPPHGQQKGFGFGERLKRAFGSSKQQHQSKEMKEPASPGTEDEDEPKTANQDGKFAPPWLTVARRAEREQHDRMIRTLNNSFESVGLIPPQDKKKPKPRHKSKGEECAVFEDVPEDSMCMLLPLWPGETSSNEIHSQSLSRTSTKNAGHAASLSTSSPSRVTTVPLQKRKFLLVYYTPFVESPMDDGFNGSSNNKKRRRPQTAGDRPHHHSHNQNNVTTVGGPSSFAVVARLLGYDDVRSSGVRLPEKGLAITGSPEAATLAIPSPSVPCLSSQVIAQCHGPENGVELVQEGLEQLGLMDHTAPRGVDVNGDPTGVKLSEVGRAVVEMVWSGCVSLMAFPA